ncbi:DUF6941 family protein [Micropruina sp.]|uniref:DUF6941 family protein n=1 Tax=Micropruina sp. TaxID=2737536 RepID=UPI0039E512BF
MTVELDYAYLAQFARVDPDGTLTALNASFLRLIADPGAGVPLAVAGRIRFMSEPYEADLTVAFRSPSGGRLDFVTHVRAEEPTTYADTRRHVLFALNTTVVSEQGEYVVEISIDNVTVRTLIVTISHPSPGE